MNLTLFSDDLSDYLKEDEVIDYSNTAIVQLADELYCSAEGKTAYIKAAFEFVRDRISHSADINEDIITCSASEVLRARHGICFAKSHLLAALLRCKSIPTGFCYQKLTFGDETSPVLVYHGLNGVYLNEYKKWIRLDARGNKGKINAQFSIDEEQLAYLVCTEKGEEDGLVIYHTPDKKILEKLRNNKTRTELWNNLPDELSSEISVD
ncbi:MAG: transglutaminase family protein [Ruminococcus sp.]|nr:transglutaminase family protein [Ruminococcus sp.]